mgnify:CR=1 FL=1
MTIYRCWNPDTGDMDDGRDFKDEGPELAATEFARWYDARSCEYGYATAGGEVALAVDGVEIGRYRVTGEQDIVYMARVVKGART